MPLALRAWFARRLATPRFQQLAIRLPLTRGIARRRARSLFELSTGFVHSQVLLGCLRAGVLDALRAGPRQLDDLAAELGLDPHRLGRLLDAAGALRLVRCRGGVVVLGDLGAAVLGNPAARAMIEHHDALYRDLMDPLALLETASLPARQATRTAALWRYAGDDAAAAPAYSALMTRSQEMIASEALAVLSLDEHRQLLDVGGGEGAFAMAAARRHPHLRVVVFDLPEVAAAARDAIRRAGLGHRASVVAGSFFGDALPRGADAASLVRVLHDHDDRPALDLLAAVRLALPAGGRLAVVEPLAGVEPAVDAYFSAYFLAMGQGRLRTPAEITALLERAGFGGVRRLPTRLPLLTGVMIAVAA